MTGRRFHVLPVAACLLAMAAWPGAAMAGNLPFVGCASDGQQGPQPPPGPVPTPTVPAAAAARLAYYAMADGTRVIAPRGWRCFGRYGSSGSTLTVAPTARAWAPYGEASRYTGPAVIRSTWFGGTSGRFAVAAFAARLFPAARGFVAGVEGEEIASAFPRGVPAADRITRRGDHEVLFTTPARASGTGTRADLAPGPLPIDGVAILATDRDHDLETMDARLPATIRPLVAHIIGRMEHEAGIAGRAPGGRGA